jgi:hypothetical protein
MGRICACVWCMGLAGIVGFADTKKRAERVVGAKFVTAVATFARHEKLAASIRRRSTSVGRSHVFFLLHPLPLTKNMHARKREAAGIYVSHVFQVLTYPYCEEFQANLARRRQHKVCLDAGQDLPRRRPGALTPKLQLHSPSPSCSRPNCLARGVAVMHRKPR